MVAYRWNFKGFEKIREDPKLRDMVDDYCEDIVTTSGEGFDWHAEVRNGKRGTRYRGIVFTETARAMVVNQRDNTLLKALRGVM